MNKILVILTGGTIGSIADANDVRDITETSPYVLLQEYEKNYDNLGYSFDTFQPFTTLSENLTLDNIHVLLRAIEDIDYSKYDGIIITHGTDTLAYTSAFVGLLFNQLPSPIFIVSSNKPIGEDGSNGLLNFAMSVKLIANKKFKSGVYVPYAKNNVTVNLHIATRIMSADNYTDDFHDSFIFPFASVDVFSSEVWYHVNPSELRLPTIRLYDVPKNFDNKVLIIHPYPGMDYDNIKLDGVKAVLQCTYHSGTNCTVGCGTNFIKFIDRCKARGVDVYTAAHKLTDGTYATTDAVEKAGVTQLYNLSIEAAYAKLLIAYNQGTVVDKRKLLLNTYLECM